MDTELLRNMRDRAAVVGVGRTKVDRERTVGDLLHLGRALRMALEDAGLARQDVDGIVINIASPEAWMDKLPEMLGLRNVSWAFQTWHHGRMQPTCIAIAAWAVMSGLAKYVACMSTGQGLSWARASSSGPRAGSDRESMREGGGPHLEAPPYGLLTPSGGAAMAMRKYLAKYGGSEDQLGQVALAQRQWAKTNPCAYFHDAPLTKEDYLNSPYVVEPLRLLDHCIPGNAGFCIIVTTAERARDCRKPPVHISGVQGSASGKETFLFSRTGLGVGQQTESAYVPPDMPVYLMAGVTQKDVDILGAFDAFSPLVLFVLEEFGFCGEGEALAWIQGGRTAPGGTLPVNTCGGGLSDVESFGWGHQVDIVRQLRGEAGLGQVTDAKVGQYASSDRSSIILTRG